MPVSLTCPRAALWGAGSNPVGYAGPSSQGFPNSSEANSSSYQPQSYAGQQYTGSRSSQPDQTADPFDHLPYPSLGLTRPSKPERAPAPPLASMGANRQQLPPGHDQASHAAAAQQAQQAQQGQASSNGFGGNVWAQPEASHKEPATASFDFGESAFSAPQASSPQQSEVRAKEVPRPKNLYINSLYNAEEGTAEDQLPPGFNPSQQVLTRK